MRRSVFKKVIEEVTQRLNGYDDFIHKGHPQGIIPVETEVTQDNVNQGIHSLSEIFNVTALVLGCGEFVIKTNLDITRREAREIRDAFQNVYNKFRGISKNADGSITVKDINELEEVSIKEVVSALKEALPVDKESKKDRGYTKEDILSGKVTGEMVVDRIAKDFLQKEKDKTFDKKKIKEIAAQKMKVFDNSLGNRVVEKLRLNSAEAKELTKKERKILHKAFEKTLYKTVGMMPWDADKAKEIYKKQVKKAIKKAEKKGQVLKNNVEQEEIER